LVSVPEDVSSWTDILPTGAKDDEAVLLIIVVGECTDALVASEANELTEFEADVALVMDIKDGLVSNPVRFCVPVPERAD
jgi:hypothetical protein